LREGLSDQIRTCKYHTAVTPLSLYHEHECPPSEFPDTMALTLRDMPGEVYKVRFSNNGAYLAAGGDAGKVTVWNTRTWDVKQVFKVATDAVTDIAWGPNDSLMVVTSMDCQVRLLNMEVRALSARARADLRGGEGGFQATLLARDTHLLTRWRLLPL
jgi:WD40 repeat protein